MNDEGYSIDVQYTSGRVFVADDVSSLAEAKRRARVEWDNKPGMSIAIWGPDKLLLVASQTYGKGMLWRRS